MPYLETLIKDTHLEFCESTRLPCLVLTAPKRSSAKSQ